MSRIWTKWLPDHIAKEIHDDEPQRFGAVARAVSELTRLATASDDPDRWLPILRYVPSLNNFLKGKAAFAVEDLQLLAESLYAVVHNTSGDIEAQCRCGDLLSLLLKGHRKELKLEVPWRPLYDLLQTFFHNPVPRLEGMGMAQTRQNVLFKLARKSRRFFPTTAASEIWELLRPALSDPRDPEAHEAVGWLVLFMPTTHLARLTPGAASSDMDINTWVREWLDCWDGLAHCHHWDGHWLQLLSRCSKHDCKGVISWGHFIPRIFTHVLWLVEVPVGTAVAQIPIPRPTSFGATMLFSSQSSMQAKSAAKLVVHLLKGPRTDGSCDVAAASLDSLCTLVEQYYHPSNGGSWTRTLSSFLHNVVKQFMKQLFKQGPEGGAGEGYVRLTPDMQQRFVRSVMQLAAMAQFSKDHHMMEVACVCLCQLSYVAPGAVLPLVVLRFRSALETAVATHQLAAAVSTLAMCVRPMMLSGWQPNVEGETVLQVVAEAMMAILPGIDANDEAKTSAVFNFYAAVLASLPGPEVQQDAAGTAAVQLPLYLEEWADEVVQRVLALLSNMDTGVGHRTGDAAASSKAGFSGQDDDAFQRFAQLVFEKLPEPICGSIVKRLADFVLSNTLPAVVNEVSDLVAAAAELHPQHTATACVQPLLKRVEEEMPEAGVTNLSQNLEATLKWQITLLGEMLYNLPFDMLLDLAPKVESLARRALQSGSKTVQALGSSMLADICVGLLGFRCVGGGSISLLSSGLQPWVDKEGTGCQAPSWLIPGEREVGYVTALVRRVVEESLAELAALTGGTCGLAPDSQAFRLRLSAVLCQIRSLLEGVMSRLPDFAFQLGGGGSPLALAGAVGPRLQLEGLREQLAEALTAACRCLSGQDPDTLALVGSVAGILLSNGYTEFHDSVRQWGEVKRVADHFCEPPVAAAHQGADGLWRKKLPMWLVRERLVAHLAWRSSQSAWRGWSTVGRPAVMVAEELPASYRALLGQVVGLSMNRYAVVRDVAVPIAESCFKRFPIMVGEHLHRYLFALAGLPQPADGADQAAAMQEICDAANSTSSQDPASLARAGTGGADAEQDGLVLGACKLLMTTISFWRTALRQPKWFAATLQALISSRQQNSPAAQGAINSLLLNLTARFKHPPSLDFDSDLYRRLSDQFLLLARPGAALTVRWRHTLLANVLTLLMMPPLEHRTAATFTAHFLELLLSEHLLLRQVAMTGLFFQLQAIVGHGRSNPEVVAALTQALRGPGVGAKLLKDMSLGHQQLDSNESNKDKRGGNTLAMLSRLQNMTFEEIITKALHAGIDRYFRWPDGEPQPLGLKEGMFEVHHARFVQLLAAVAPAETLEAFKDAVQQSAVEKVVPGNVADKADQCTVAEVLAGLVAAGAPLRVPQSAGWVLQLMSTCLQSTTLELADSWQLAIRFGLWGLLEASQPGSVSGLEAQQALAGVGAMLQITLGTPGQGEHAQLPQQLKRLKYLTGAVAQLRKIELAREVTPEVAAFWSSVMGEVSALLASDAASLREPLGALLGLATGHFSPTVHPEDVAPSHLSSTDLDATMEGSGESSHTIQQATVTARIHSSALPLERQARDLLQQLQGGYEEGATELQRMRADPNGEGLATSAQEVVVGDVVMIDAATLATSAIASDAVVIRGGAAGDAPGAGTSGGDEVSSHTIAQVGFGLCFMSHTLRAGDMVQLRGALQALLPPLLGLQELGGPRLQALALEAKSAFALMKYLPLLPQNVSAVVDAVVATSTSDLWVKRCAALVFVQYFWFRHHFLLSRQQSAALQEFVMSRLSDSKVEVRAIAAASLSGLLRGLAPAELDTLRTQLLQRAKDLFSSRRGRAKAAAAVADASVAEKHACVLGLKAFVMSHPYDLPAWMPGVLLALASAAGHATATIRGEVSRTLSEFKRTHEQDSLMELRALLEPEQWDELQQVTSQASYFA